MKVLGRFTGVYLDLDPSSSKENQDDALGRFTGVYIDFDPSNSVEIQDDDFYTSQKNMALNGFLEMN